jgi:transcriptional regulator GlxA family with amidase domain
VGADQVDRAVEIRGLTTGYLATTTKNVSHVAHLVGYDSDASFSKAFSRAFGRPPGYYRFAAPTLADHGDA